MYQNQCLAAIFFWSIMLTCIACTNPVAEVVNLDLQSENSVTKDLVVAEANKHHTRAYFIQQDSFSQFAEQLSEFEISSSGAKYIQAQFNQFTLPYRQKDSLTFQDWIEVKKTWIFHPTPTAMLDGISDNDLSSPNNVFWKTAIEKGDMQNGGAIPDEWTDNQWVLLHLDSELVSEPILQNYSEQDLPILKRDFRLFLRIKVMGLAGEVHEIRLDNVGSGYMISIG